MSVTIRLMRFGKKGQPYYRIVAIDKTRKAKGSYIEELGSYNPMTKPHVLNYKEDRVQYWMGVGATISDGLQKIKFAQKK